MNTHYWLNKIMDTMYVNNAGQFWVGLSSTVPGADGSNVTEPTGSDYSRVQITRFTAADEGFICNADDLIFPKSTSIWFPADAKAVCWVLFDGADSGAKLLGAGDLSAHKTIEENSRVTLEARTLGITLTDYHTDLV